MFLFVLSTIEQHDISRLQAKGKSTRWNSKTNWLQKTKKERGISAAVKRPRKKRSRDEDEKVKRLGISATEKRVIHRAAKKREKGEAKEEEQRVVSQKQYDDLLSSFRLFREDDRSKK